MTNMKLAEETIILKRDEAGRVRMPADRREQLLDEFERSGLSGVKFAALAGIKYQTFATWARLRRKQLQGTQPGQPAGARPVRWLEAVMSAAAVSGSNPPTPLVLQLPGGTRLEVADERQARLAVAIIQALDKTC